MSEYVIGIDIGGTKLATVVADKNAKILNKIRRPTESNKGPEFAIQTLFEMIYETIEDVNIKKQDISGIGVSCGGPLDTKTGIVYSPPNLPGWDAYPLKNRLENEFNIQSVIENDANASALAEYRFGGGKGYDIVLYMTMSTGIGGGIVINGEIYHGTNDSAGEVGHQILLPNGPLCGCGKRGCLEALCSGPSIARRAKETVENYPESLILTLVNGDIDSIKSEHVFEAAKQEDEVALKLVDVTAYYMGWGIANLVNILNPDIVLLGTIAIAAGDLLLDPIRKTVSDLAMIRPAEVVRIMPAKLGESLGDMAAISLVI
ncbi:ROK family protein [Candidatus Poribacteria bacterium]|nr:ROK family protein [Candidatus Poribacteria bacterium]